MTRKPPTTVHRTSTTPTTTTPAATTTTTAAATTSTSTTAAPLEDEATILPTATEPSDTDGEEGKTEAETATRRTRRPGSGSGGGKKKKNKNKRRKNRPGSASASGANGTALAESKVGEQADDGALVNGTRPAHAKDRPLTTRIYNYLAREVMPSFGVGLLGLAITAGLAGLIMYPFGGGAAKRTYEVDAPALPSHGNFYYYGGDYDQGDDHGQAEESVIRKVFEGMQGAEGEQAEDQRYAGDGGDAAVAGGTVTTYAGDVHGGQPYAPQGFGGGPALAYNGAGNYYNVEQANKYYSSSPSGRVESGPMHTAPAPNATATAAAADGRVRYHEAAPAAAPPSAPADAGGPSPSTQHITKKSDYYAYNGAGRVRYRDVGTGHVTADLTQAPRVRFREVGSDTVHYSLSDQTSSEGGVEHGPRHVRVRRQTLDMADIGRKMADAHRQMAAEVADFADHAKKVSDKSVELGNEIEMLFAKKGTKPKKPTQAAKPIKMKKEETDDEQVTKSVMDEEEDDELSTSIMDPENFTDGPSDYETHVELVTGVPDHTSVEELAEQVQDDGVMNEFESEMPVYVRPTYASTEQVEADTTTTDTAEQPTTVPETSTGGAPDAEEATTVHSPTHAPPRPPPQSSIVDLLKQIAQLKIRLGIDFLKSTSRAFASYLDGLQRNMEDAIKQGSTAQYRRTGFWNYRRSKRDAKKTFNLKKKKSKSD